MLSTQWCFCTYLALFSLLSISTIDANSHHKHAKHHKSTQKYRTIIVDPSRKKGGFMTIQAAIDSVPSNNQRWICVHVRKGTCEKRRIQGCINIFGFINSYREQVKVPDDKPFIYFKGDGQKTTQVVWDAHDSIATSATFSTQADYIIVKDMSFINSYNHPPNATHNPRKTAVAASVYGDKSVFYKCGFYGVQDTLWDVQGRHYFKECNIEGAIDFVFGAGQSHYEGCRISVIARAARALGYITAQGRGHEQDSNGFIFKNCTIDGSGKTYLGRAWRDHARVVFYNTYMSKIVVPRGWEPLSAIGHENQLTFAENNCRGPGSHRSKRVHWEKKLSAPELKKLTSISFIDNEGWINELPSDFFNHKIKTDI